MPASAQLTDQDIKKIRQEVISKGYNFTVGHNSATKRSVKELCGLVVPENWKKNARDKGLFKEIVYETVDPPPDNYNLCVDDNGDICPAIRDQGQCGSCWAFATVGLLDIKLGIEFGEKYNLSEQDLLSCNKDGYSCDGGWFAHKYHLLAEGGGGETDECDFGPGAVDEVDYPYTAEDDVCDCGGENNHNMSSHIYSIDSWAFVGENNDPTSRGRGVEIQIPEVDDIKQAIYDNGPVAAGVAVNRSFMAYTGGIFRGRCKGLNHTVIIVGWCDVTELREGGYWIVRNSWGTGWGEDGYMRIAYDNNCIGFAANYIGDVTNFPPLIE